MHGPHITYRQDGVWHQQHRRCPHCNDYVYVWYPPYDMVINNEMEGAPLCACPTCDVVNLSIPREQLNGNSSHCWICERLWPLHYLICPVCDEATENDFREPMGPTKARDLKNAGLFGWFLVSQWLAGDLALEDD